MSIGSKEIIPNSVCHKIRGENFSDSFSFFVPYRLAVAVGTSVVVSGALYLLNPVVGLLSGAVCTITITGKVVYEKTHHDFEDITISYMIRQLIDANNLIVTSRGEISFIHNNHVIVLSSPPEDINEDTNAENAVERE